jgi:hypothetical protein
MNTLNIIDFIILGLILGLAVWLAVVNHMMVRRTNTLRYWNNQLNHNLLMLMPLLNRIPGVRTIAIDPDSLKGAKEEAEEPDVLPFGKDKDVA